MSSSLAQSLATADARGEDPFLAAVRAAASQDVLRAGYVLSIVLAATESTLVDLLDELWPGDGDHARAVRELLGWPFVETTTDGHRLNDAASAAIRMAFLEAEPSRFRRAHEVLADRESTEEAEADSAESWFVRGRVAYYLAGFDGEASVRLLGESFGAPPPLDRTGARMWLSWIAIRQEPLLEDQQRELSFFRGFRAYVMGAFREARRDFDTVVEGNQADRYQALASHFAGLLRRRDAPDAGVVLLTEAVRLSQALDLRENEVMARQSLVTALLARGDEGDLRSAGELAALNLERAPSHDESLVLWCKRAALGTRWLALTDNRRHVTTSAREQASGLLSGLRLVVDEGLRIDPETAVIGANDAAGLLRDVGDHEGTLKEITAFLHEATTASVPPASLSRLAKTAGSLYSVADPSLAPTIRSVIAAVEREQRIRTGVETRSSQIDETDSN